MKILFFSHAIGTLLLLLSVHVSAQSESLAASLEMDTDSAGSATGSSSDGGAVAGEQATSEDPSAAAAESVAVNEELPVPVTEATPTTAPSSAADDADETKRAFGIYVGARGGYAVPWGEVVDGQKLGDMTNGRIPVLLEASLLGPIGLELGAYVELGVGRGAAKFEKNCTDCSIFGIRAGLELNKHGNRLGAVDPWIGLAAGIETLSVSRRYDSPAITSGGDVVTVEVTADSSLQALPELQLQGGVEFGNENFRIGPFAMVSASVYSTTNTTYTCDSLFCPDESTDGYVSDSQRTWHGFFTVGIRGGYVIHP